MTTTPPAPTLTPATDANPCPRVEVLISTMPSDAVSVTIWRTWSGNRKVIRGASDTPVSGDFLIVDYEAPLGVPITYTCQTEDVGGVPSQVSSSSSAVTLDVAVAWAQDALDPGSALPIGLDRYAGLSTRFAAGSFGSATYSAFTVSSPIVGSDLPFAGADVRRQASQLPLRIVTVGDSATGALRDLIGHAFPLCLRVPARVRPIAPLAYLALPDVTESPDIQNGRSLWSMSADLVTGPGLSVIVPTRIYDDLPNEAATYNDLTALYATYIDLQRG